MDGYYKHITEWRKQASKNRVILSIWNSKTDKAVTIALQDTDLGDRFFKNKTIRTIKFRIMFHLG